MVAQQEQRRSRVGLDTRRCAKGNEEGKNEMVPPECSFPSPPEFPRMERGSHCKSGSHLPRQLGQARRRGFAASMPGACRAPRADNWLAATAFTTFAGLAGFAVPIEVGGDRLAFMATASDADVPPGSYLAGPTGSKGYTRADGFDDGIRSAEARDDDKAKRLWEISAAAVGWWPKAAAQ